MRVQRNISSSCNCKPSSYLGQELSDHSLLDSVQILSNELNKTSCTLFCSFLTTLSLIKSPIRSCRYETDDWEQKWSGVIHRTLITQYYFASVLMGRTKVSFSSKFFQPQILEYFGQTMHGQPSSSHINLYCTFYILGNWFMMNIKYHSSEN